MKAQVMMIAALLLSGAVFAQEAKVKGNADAKIAAEAGKSGAKANTAVSATSGVAVNTADLQKVRAGAVDRAEHKISVAADHAVSAKGNMENGVLSAADHAVGIKEQMEHNIAATADQALVAGAAITGNAGQTASAATENTVLTTGMKTAANAKAGSNHLKADQFATGRIKSSGIKSTVSHSAAVQMKAVPVKINTGLSSAVGLRIR